MNLQSTIYYNKGHVDRPVLKRGEKVFLLQQNIKTKWPSQKLDHQKIRPFKIEEKLGPMNYQLKLPESMKHLHPVFHILLLEPTPKNTQTAENIKIKSNKEYEVEWILKDKCINRQPSYLVKWKGYSTSENTWEPIAHLVGCHDKVKEYHQWKDQGHSRKKENSLFESD